ncbi:MAG: DUF4340 domain-containing protein, partial [Planctomycetes bacterium]|nr:DUF4340 domain-containing protein [Planctomycetota bacterium]
MNRTTLLLMFALVCAAGAAVMLRRAPEKRSPTGGDPLATVNWAGVRSLHCRRADGQEWTMLLKGGEWWLESPTVAEGRAVAANDQLRLNIFGVLHDVIPLESRPVAEISKGEWGLEPPELAVTIRDADGEVAIHFGRPDLNQELYYCTPDGKAVYKTDKLSVEELARDVVWLREPRLIDTNLEAAFFVEITPRDAPAYSLERSGLLWLIVHPDGSRRRADHTLTEQVVNGLCRMEGEPVTREDLGVELPEDPYCRITVRDGAGKQNIYDILYVDDNEQFLIAKRP